MFRLPLILTGNIRPKLLVKKNSGEVISPRDVFFNFSKRNPVCVDVYIGFS